MTSLWNGLLKPTCHQPLEKAESLAKPVLPTGFKDRPLTQHTKHRTFVLSFRFPLDLLWMQLEPATNT